jgi:hypothetical protein
MNFMKPCRICFPLIISACALRAQIVSPNANLTAREERIVAASKS